MPNTPLSKVPYPSGSDAPAAAADMMAAFMALDDRLVLKAVDEADRNARYAEAPTGSFCVSGESTTVWFKTGPGPTEWFTLYSDTGWVDQGFTVFNGWELQTVRGRRKAGNTEIRGQVLRTGDALSANSTGHLPDTDVISVPPQLRPEPGLPAITGQGRASTTSGTVELYATGQIRLVDLHANSSVGNGEYLRFSLFFMGA